MATEGEPRITLTRNVRQRLLEQNEGYTARTYYRGKNFREQRDYEIRGGELHIRSRGKTSWADSRFDDSLTANEDQTRRFLRNNLHALNTDGLTRPAPAEVPPCIAEVDFIKESESVEPADFASLSEDGQGDDYGRLSVAAGIAVLAALYAAPYVKRWWDESLLPRARRFRREAAARGNEEPARDEAEDAGQ